MKLDPIPVTLPYGREARAILVEFFESEGAAGSHARKHLREFTCDPPTPKNGAVELYYREVWKRLSDGSGGGSHGHSTHYLGNEETIYTVDAETMVTVSVSDGQPAEGRFLLKTAFCLTREGLAERVRSGPERYRRKFGLLLEALGQAR
jgi:hypothetical protein